MNNQNPKTKETIEMPMQYPTIKFKKLVPDAVIPSYAKPGDAGLDLTVCAFEKDPADLSKLIIYFGIAVELPVGFVGLIFPRSSIRDRNLILSNGVGVIDSGYRGELRAVFIRLNGAKDYIKGERAAQLVPMPIPTLNVVEVEELSDSERGTGGFGSTGK